jgi:integrase
MVKSTDRRSRCDRKRGNGEGSLYEYRGRWRAAVTWTDEGGRLRRRTISAPTFDEARQRLTRLRADLDAGKAPATTGTVAEYLSRWLEAERQRVRPSTWRQREQYVRSYVVPALGSMPLAKVAPTDVERMTAGMVGRGLSPRTAAHCRVILRRALADAQRDGLVHGNSAALARPPRVATRSMEAGRDYLDPTQLRRLLEASMLHPLGPLVTLAATTGMRQGELLGLRWRDIHSDGRSLTVHGSMARGWDGGWVLAEPKTARSRRTINLPARAITALEAQRQRQDTHRVAAGRDWQDRDGLVFTDEVGRALRGYTVTAELHRLLEIAGLPSVPFHALRHSCATALLAAGVPLKVVSETLGHTTIVVTANTYAAVTPELRRDAADALDRTLGHG